MSFRYKLAPQMQVYDKMRIDWKPYIMFFNESNFYSKVLNTDNFGLRFNNSSFKKKKSIFDEKIITKKRKAALIGASTAFGVGATKDENSISAQLSKKTDFHFFNISGKAFSGYQETILFQTLLDKIGKIDKIVIFSGLNDIFMQYYIEDFDETLGPFFFNDVYIDAMNSYNLGWKRKSLRILLSPFLQKRINWSSLSKKELKQIVFGNKKIINKSLNKFDNLNYLNQRNLKFWSSIQKLTKIKITYVLQPLSSWCEKKFSGEEKMIFNELDNTSIRTFNVLRQLDKIRNYKIYSRNLKNICNKNNIKFVDANELIKKSKFNREWLFVDRAHLTDLGYKRMSELLIEKI